MSDFGMPDFETGDISKPSPPGPISRAGNNADFCFVLKEYSNDSKPL